MVLKKIAIKNIQYILTLLLAILILLLWTDTKFDSPQSQTIKPTTKPTPTIIHQEKDLSTIVSEWSPYVVLVTCWWRDIPNNYYQRGSSIIRYNHDTKQIDILTNRHVLTYHNNNPDECLFSTDSNHNYATSGIDFYPAANNIDAQIVAFAKNTNPIERFKEYDKENFAYFKQIATSSPLLNPEKFCKNVAIGDKIVILGFPYTGGDFGTNITATEGIISGFDGNFYVTSAKIEQGNSGGVAISLQDNCYLGIPSNVATGHYESLGRILRWQALSFKR